MFKKILSHFFSVIIIFAAVFFGSNLIFAWTEPASNPPNWNAAAPLNVSNSAQTKGGGLIINTNGAATGLSVFKGNVGIGTVGPVSHLDVRGSNSAGSTVSGSNTSAGSWSLSNQGSPGASRLAIGADGGSVGTTERVSIIAEGANAGNVGIGTINPSSPLEVNRPGVGRISAFFGTTANGDTEISVGNSAAVLDSAVLGYNRDNNYAYFSVYGLMFNRLVMTDAGNVGVGTTNPSARLEVNGDVRAGTGASGYFYFGTGNAFHSSPYYIGDDGTGIDIQTNAPNMYVYDGGWKRLLREGDPIGINYGACVENSCFEYGCANWTLTCPAGFVTTAMSFEYGGAGPHPQTIRIRCCKLQ